MSDNVWGWLDRGSILLSYVTLLTLLVGVVQFLRLARDYRRRQRQLRSQAVGKTLRPEALAISFGGSIKTAVEEFVALQFPGVVIPVREYAESLEVTPQNVHLHLQRLREQKERLQSSGVTELHVFFKGPVALALGLGAIFDNWVSVKVYQNNRSGVYEEWLTLETAKAQPLTATIQEKILTALESPDEASPTSQ